MFPFWTAALVMASPPGVPTDEIPGFEPDFEAIQKGEAAAIASSGGRISRKGHTLRFKTGRGPRLFRDTPVEGEGFQGYRLADMLLEGTHALVLSTGWESWGFLLVHLPTGRIMALDGPPLLSPDGTHAVVHAVDLGSDYRSNTLTIIRFTEQGPQRAFKYAFGRDAGPSDPVWKEDGTIRFHWNKVVSRSPRIQTMWVPGRLYLHQGKWILR